MMRSGGPVNLVVARYRQAPYPEDALPTITFDGLLKTVRDRVQAMLAAGKSLEEVVAANPAADFEEAYGKVEASLGFIDRVYTSLAKKR